MTQHSFSDQRQTALDYGLSDGDTIRVDCPFCGHKNTYSVQRAEGTVLWNCFSASCSVHGMSAQTARTTTLVPVCTFRRKDHAKSSDVPRASSKFHIPEYFTEIPQGDGRAVDILKSYHSIDIVRRGNARVMLDPRQNRIVFIIRDYTYTQSVVYSGGVGRLLWTRMDGNSASEDKPRWYNYHQNTTPFIVRTNPARTSTTCVLVEDPFSACNLAHIVDACALGGTEFHAYFARHLRSYTHLILALDHDATVKALDLRRKLAMIRPTSMLFLDRDLKHYCHQDLKALVVPHL